MKIKKLTLLVLASMAVGVLAGCGGKKSSQPSEQQPSSNVTPDTSVAPEEMPAEYDLLKFWAGNEAEEFYDVKESEGMTEITYTNVTGEDSGGWAYVARSFAYDAAKVARFNEYKKITFRGKLVKTSGSDVVMVKVEGSDGNQWEKKFTFEPTMKVYEFGLNFISDWSKVSQILFFVNRSTNESGSGKITLTKMALSKEEVDPAHDIAPGMPSVPQGAAIFNGLGASETKFNVMYHWGYASDSIVTEEVQGGYKFSWGGDIAKPTEWAYVSSHFKNGSAQVQTAGFQKLVYEVQGTAGQEVLFKLECLQGGAKEIRATMTGEKQIVEVPTENVLTKAEAVEWMAMIFAAPGQTGTVAVGELVLTACYLDTAEYVPPVQPQAYNIYSGGDSFVVMTDWRENGSHNFGVEATAAGYVITWTTKGPWENMLARVKVADGQSMAAMKRAVFTVNGLAGRTALAKIELHNEAGGQVGAKEQSVTFDGSDQAVEVDISEIAATPFAEMWVLLFPDQNSNGQEEQGHLTLKNCVIDTTEVTPVIPVPDPSNVATFNGAYLETTCYSAAQLNRELDSTTHTTTYTFENLAPDWGNNVQFKISLHDDISWANKADYRQFYGIFTSTVDLKILIKPYDDGSVQQSFDLVANNPQIISFEIAADKVDFSKALVLFVNPGDASGAKSGTLTVQNMAMLKAGVSMAGDDLVCFSEHVGNYSFALTSSGFKVSYAKEALGYDAAFIYVLDSGAGYNKVHMKFNSTVATHIIIKPLDQAANEINKAVVVGENVIDQVFPTPLNEMFGQVTVMIGFADGDALEGELTFSELEFSVAQPIEQPQGAFYAPVEILVAADTYKAVPIFVEFGAENAVAVTVNGQSAGAASIKSYEQYTGKMVVETANYGDINFKYNPETSMLEGLALASNPTLLRYNGYQNLRGGDLLKYWNCDGDDTELQSQFNRRYGSSSWTVDTTNANRIVKEEALAVRGSAARVLKDASARYSIATKDFNKAFNARNLSFWVYNDGASAVTIQCFGYKSTGYSNYYTIKNDTSIPAGQWTYISAGFTAADTYGFQIICKSADVSMIVDDICLI